MSIKELSIMPIVELLEVEGRAGYCKVQVFPEDRRALLDFMAAGSEEDQADMLEKVFALAADKGLEKITARVHPAHAPQLFGYGFQLEASVPGYFGGEENALWLSRFLSPERRGEKPDRDAGLLLELQYGGNGDSTEQDLTECDVRWLEGSELVTLVDVYQRLEQGGTKANLSWQEIIGSGLDGLDVAVLSQRGRLKGAVTVRHDHSLNNAQASVVTGDRISEEEVAAMLVAARQRARNAGARCLYTVSPTQLDIVNRALPRCGFLYRGCLHAETLKGDRPGDRFVWSLSL